MKKSTDLANPGLADKGNATFLIRWRGRQEGPYPMTIIEQKLAANEIGLLHEVFHDGQWLTIRDYFAQQETVRRTEHEAQDEADRRSRETAERESRMRQENIEEQRLLELKRQNDLLEQQANSGHSSTQGAPVTGAKPGMAQPWVSYPPKSRVIYVILGLFLGGLGMHNFYAGFNGKGFVQLIITLTGLVFFFPLIIVGIWVLLEVITVKADANGVTFQ